MTDEYMELEDATLEQLVEALGPRVYRDVGPQGQNVGKVLGQMAIISEIHDRGAIREAAELALEKWPELKEGIDEDTEDWLDGLEEDYPDGN